MAKFMGTYEHTLDDKGRLILPASFRAKLAEGAIALPADRCLAIVPPNEFEHMADHFRSRVSQGKAETDHLLAFASLAEEVIPDSQGRMRLSPQLREIAGLDRAVIVIGALQRIEVWNPDRWSAVFPSGPAKFVSALVREYGLGSPDSEQIN